MIDPFFDRKCEITVHHSSLFFVVKNRKLKDIFYDANLLRTRDVKRNKSVLQKNSQIKHNLRQAVLSNSYNPFTLTSYKILYLKSILLELVNYC